MNSKIDNIITKELQVLVSQSIACKLCHEVLSDPFDCAFHSETFCKVCISEFIQVHQRCPCSSETTSETGIQIKKSSTILTKLINSLKFYCVNKKAGCMAELDNKSFNEHIKTCRFGTKTSQVNPEFDNSFNSSAKICRNRSVMSFSNQDNPFETNYEPKTQPRSIEEKVDKIFDYMHYLQHCMNTRNVLSTPSKDCNAETPKFSINHGSSNVADSHILGNNNQSFLQNLQHEKIISELDIVSERLSQLENNIADHLSQEAMKKLLEEHLLKLLDKLSDRSVKSPTSTQANSVNSSVMHSSLAKSQSTSRLATTNSCRKIQINKAKVNNTKFSKSPVKQNTPKISKKLFEANDVASTKRSLRFECDGHSENLKDIERKINLLQETLTQQRPSYIEDLKDILHNCVNNDMKLNFLEVTLDLSNLFIQKFDELQDVVTKSAS